MPMTKTGLVETPKIIPKMQLVGQNAESLEVFKVNEAHPHSIVGIKRVSKTHAYKFGQRFMFKMGIHSF